MSLMQKLFSFDGRIRRRDWWLLSIASAVVFYAIVFGFAFGLGQPGPDGQMTNPAGAIGFIFYLPLLWISLALQVKRWHDRDKAWYWLFISFIPLVGGIWVLIECGFLDGTPGPNRFGPSPKGIGATSEAFA